jgi:hypothetical protein
LLVVRYLVPFYMCFFFPILQKNISLESVKKSCIFTLTNSKEISTRDIFNTPFDLLDTKTIPS